MLILFGIIGVFGTIFNQTDLAIGLFVVIAFAVVLKIELSKDTPQDQMAKYMKNREKVKKQMDEKREEYR